MERLVPVAVVPGVDPEAGRRPLEDRQPRLPEHRPGPVAVAEERVVEGEVHALEERRHQAQVGADAADPEAAGPQPGTRREGRRLHDQVARLGVGPHGDDGVAVPSLDDAPRHADRKRTGSRRDRSDGLRRPPARLHGRRDRRRRRSSPSRPASPRRCAGSEARSGNPLPAWRSGSPSPRAPARPPRGPTRRLVPLPSRRRRPAGERPHSPPRLRRRARRRCRPRPGGNGDGPSRAPIRSCLLLRCRECTERASATADSSGPGRRKSLGMTATSGAGRSSRSARCRAR